MTNVVKTIDNFFREKLQENFVEVVGDKDNIPHGVKWLGRSIKRVNRFTNRERRVRKPEPKGRAALVARQKKARPRYPRG